MSANSKQQVAAQQFWQYLRQEMNVALAARGVAVYSTFTYLARTLQHLHPEACTWCRVFAIGSGGGTGVTLTIRQERLVVLPGTLHNGELEAV